MKIAEEKKPYLGVCEKFKNVYIPVGKKEVMEKIANEYLETCIYNDIEIAITTDNFSRNYMDYKEYKPYCESEYAGGDYLIDLIGNRIVERSEYLKTTDKDKKHIILESFAGSMYLRQNFTKAAIKDDIYCLFCSKIDKDTFKNIKNGDKGPNLKVTSIFFVFKNRVVLSASLHYGEIDFAQMPFSVLQDIFLTEPFERYKSHFLFTNNGKWQARVLFREYFGIQYINGNTISMLNDKDLRKFLKKPQCHYEKDEMVDKLNALITDYSFDMKERAPEGYKLRIGMRMILFERHEGIIAMRFLYLVKLNEMEEIYRVFYKDGNITVLENNACYGFVKSKKKLPKSLCNWKLCKKNFPEDMTEFKYSLALLGDSEDSQINLVELFNIMSNNMLEQLWKAGFELLVKATLKTAALHNFKVETAPSICFGKLGPKTNIYSYLGVNKYQLERLKESKYYTNEKFCTDDKQADIRVHISIIKYILGMQNISSIDNNSFDLLFDWLLKFNRHTTVSGETLKKYDMWYMVPPYVTKDYENYYSAFIKCFAALYQYSRQLKLSYDIVSVLVDNLDLFGAMYTNHVIDTCSMAGKLKKWGLYNGNPFRHINKPDIDAVKEEIKEIHDNMVELFNAAKEKEVNEAFKAYKKKWKKYEYCGDEFSVVAPTCTLDIAMEGEALHHCVRTFIDDVKQGKTNILFIRRNNELDKPFFTAEVDKNNRVRQIHGLQNCNTDTVDGLETFVKEWMKERKIKKCDYNNILAARG